MYNSELRATYISCIVGKLGRLNKTFVITRVVKVSKGWVLGRGYFNTNSFVNGLN